jgi:thioredoxin 1
MNNNKHHETQIIALGKDNFERVVSSSGIVLVDCWARWCNACKEFKPVFEKASLEHSKHTFASLDTQQEKELVDSLGIEHIPSLLLYRDGLMLFNQPGTFDSTGLESIITQAESLDMNEVRAAIEAEAAEIQHDDRL